MNTMTLTSRTGRDGSLDLHVLTNLPEQSVEVLVVVQSIPRPERAEGQDSWPKGFFDRTAGCLSADPIRRLPQGDFDRRETLR